MDEQTYVKALGLLSGNWRPLDQRDITYEDLYTSCGLTILIKLDDADYQGDSFLIVKSPALGIYGYSTFGWGSCSGCDSLEAAGDDQKAREKLREELFDGIVWQPDKASMLAWLKTHDWAGDYHDRTTESKKLIKAVQND